jgi:hypothetical protein
VGIVSCNKLYGGRSGSGDLFGHRTYSETYEVVTNSVLDNELTVTSILAVGLPRVGTRHPSDPAAILVSHEPTQSDDSPFIWYVVAKYDTAPDFPNSTDPDGTTTDPAQIPENPLLRPPVWKVSFRTNSEPAREWKRIDDKDTIAAAYTLVANSAKFPFDPPLMVECARPVLRVTRNVQLVTVDYLMKLEGAINEKPWRGFPKWCARIEMTEASGKFENGIAYVELTIDIALNKDTWIPKVLDAGFHEMTERTQPTGPPKLVPTRIRDPFGGDGPYPLDGNGHKLPGNGEPVFLRGLPKQYQLADFAALLGF